MTRSALLRLIGLGVFVWAGVLVFIRLTGPDLFHGWRAVLLYAVTIPVTISLNRRVRCIAGGARVSMPAAVAVGTATAPLLEGIVMAWLPELYGDPSVIAGGSAWILWAIGVAAILALRTDLTEAAARPVDA